MIDKITVLTVDRGSGQCSKSHRLFPDEPKGLIGNQRVGLHGGQQVIRADEIMRLAARQMKADRVAKRIDEAVDLGAQAAARAADGLVCVDFFGAPAPC